MQSDGLFWGGSDDYREAVREVVESIKLDPDMVTMYALRHSSIVRQLLRGVPIRVIAGTHDTSTIEIERTYSKHITDHSDDISRAALLHYAPVADKSRRTGS